MRRSHVVQYDPTKVARQQLAKKWVELFNDTRTRLRQEVAEIRIAN